MELQLYTSPYLTPVDGEVGQEEMQVAHIQEHVCTHQQYTHTHTHKYIDGGAKLLKGYL